MAVAQAARPGGRALSRPSQAPAVNVGDTERMASVVGGGLLALFGLASRDTVCQVVCPLLGAALAYRGLTGHCYGYQVLGVSTAEQKGAATAVRAGHGSRVDHTVTVNRPAAELYRFWRQLDNLPRVMSNLREVRLTGAKTSHWVAQGPLGLSAEWDAEIHNERANEMIAWRSTEGSSVDTAGSVHFTPVSGGATRVRVELKYDPPAGKVGATVAWLLGESPEVQVREDLDKFKRLAESGQLHASRATAAAGAR